MNKSLWSLLLLATIPGCLLAQPLDGAASSSDGDDSSSKAGASSAGSSSSSRAGAKGSSGATGASGSNGASGASGATSTAGKTAPFLGTWTATSGMLTITCSGVAPSSSDVTGTVETWTVGTTTDLIQKGFEGDCDFTANVRGRTATALPGQSCMESGTDDTSGDSYTQELAFDNYEFVVSSNGTTATQIFNGEDTYTDTTAGVTLDCTFNETATFEM